jgi:hypothetical protein
LEISTLAVVLSGPSTPQPKTRNSGFDEMRSISLGQVGEVVCESQTELGYTIVTFKGSNSPQTRIADSRSRKAVSFTQDQSKQDIR